MRCQHTAPEPTPPLCPGKLGPWRRLLPSTAVVASCLCLLGHLVVFDFPFSCLCQPRAGRGRWLGRGVQVRQQAGADGCGQVWVGGKAAASLPGRVTQARSTSAISKVLRYSPSLGRPDLVLCVGFFHCRKKDLAELVSAALTQTFGLCPAQGERTAWDRHPNSFVSCCFLTVGAFLLPAGLRRC